VCNDLLRGGTECNCLESLAQAVPFSGVSLLGPWVAHQISLSWFGHEPEIGEPWHSAVNVALREPSSVPEADL
jgi:hypothetical protein